MCIPDTLKTDASKTLEIPVWIEHARPRKKHHFSLEKCVVPEKASKNIGNLCIRDTTDFWPKKGWFFIGKVCISQKSDKKRWEFMYSWDSAILVPEGKK